MNANAQVRVAQGGGAACSDARLAYCKAKGMDDGGYGPMWVHNHCKRSPYGPRFEYLVPTWECLHEP